MATIQRPYGDSFLVNTPALDRLSMQLYNDRKLREAEQRRQSQLLDEQYARNIANIRDADVPEYNQKYQTWRQARQDLLRAKHLKADEYIKRQMDVNKLLGDVYAFGNKSKQTKDEEEQIAKDFMSHPDKYSDDAHNLLLYRRNVPTSRLQGNPLSDYNTFLYKGNTSKLQPLFDKARGMLRQIGEPTIDDASDSLNHVITTYKGYNSPVDYYNQVAGGLIGAKAHKDLLALHDYSPEDEAKITADYNAWRQRPEVIKAYGVNGTQLPQIDLTEEGRTIRLLAMENALSHPLTSQVTYKPKVKETIDYKEGQKYAFEDYRQKHRKEIARINLGNAAWLKQNVPTYHDLKESNENIIGANKVISEVSDILKNARIAEDGDKNDVYLGDPTILKAFKDIDPTTTAAPSDILYNRDNNSMYLIYRDSKGDETGRQQIDPSTYLKLKVKQTYPNKDIGEINNVINSLYEKNKHHLNALTKDYENTVDLAAKASQNNSGRKAKFPLPKGKPKTVKQNGYIYTWNEQTGQYE